MIGYYSKSILDLLNRVHIAREDPYDNLQKWKTIQLELVKKNIYIENKIRSANKNIKELNILRKDPKNILSKEKSLATKAKLKRLKENLEKLRYILKIYKSIGDAIAFTFIHKLNIKPQNFKESAGFISEKEGLKKELQAFNYAYKNNTIAILHDLTSVLKYNDITLITKNHYASIEIKSSKLKNSRVDRQAANAEKLFDYLNNDITDNLYGIEGVMQRKELLTPEINYIEKVNEAIEKSKVNGHEFISVEKGVSYLVSRSNKNNFENNFKEHLRNNFKEPILFSLNKMKFLDQGHYPFSLSIKNPQDYLDFHKGKFVIIIFIDFAICRDIAKRHKFTVKKSEFPYMFEFENFDKNREIMMFKLSEHMFLRTIIEFVSPKWLLNDSFKRFTKFTKPGIT